MDVQGRHVTGARLDLDDVDGAVRGLAVERDAGEPVDEPERPGCGLCNNSHGFLLSSISELSLNSDSELCQETASRPPRTPCSCSWAGAERALTISSA